MSNAVTRCKEQTPRSREGLTVAICERQSCSCRESDAVSLGCQETEAPPRREAAPREPMCCSHTEEVSSHLLAFKELLYQVFCPHTHEVRLLPHQHIDLLLLPFKPCMYPAPCIVWHGMRVPICTTCVVTRVKDMHGTCSTVSMGGRQPLFPEAERPRSCLI